MGTMIFVTVSRLLTESFVKYDQLNILETLLGLYINKSCKQNLKYTFNYSLYVNKMGINLLFIS